jgi:hypothetical protein
MDERTNLAVVECIYTVSGSYKKKSEWQLVDIGDLPLTEFEKLLGETMVRYFSGFETKVGEIELNQDKVKKAYNALGPIILKGVKRIPHFVVHVNASDPRWEW